MISVGSPEMSSICRTTSHNFDWLITIGISTVGKCIALLFTIASAVPGFISEVSTLRTYYS